ncbi:MAG: respiratory nitrate reductase subunit gamma, partial [Archaeoglobaceae archaeon]
TKFFFEPVPSFVEMLSELEAFKGVFIPSVYVSGLAIIAALLLLWFRRIFLSRERCISLPSDHFALIVLLAITISGNVMRYFIKVDISAVKGLLLSLMTFDIAKAVEFANAIEPMFYIHFALGSFLLAYFPFSKLMHAGGIFLSPTRNMPNNNRAERHVNPWNPPYKGITWQEYYEAYKDQLDEIAESGYKVKPEVM